MKVIHTIAVETKNATNNKKGNWLVVRYAT